MSVKDELLALKNSSADGNLHPEEAVVWARQHKRSALYGTLEWDDSIAAEQYRVDQVRHLIRVYLVFEDGTPQMVSLSIDRPQKGGYREVSEVLKDRDLSAVMLRDALVELERVQKKYERVKELTSIWVEVKRVQQRATRRQHRSKTQRENRPSA